MAEIHTMQSGNNMKAAQGLALLFVAAEAETKHFESPFSRASGFKISL